MSKTKSETVTSNKFDEVIFQKHFLNATDGLPNSSNKSILKLTRSNAKLIVDYINSSLSHENLTILTRRNKIIVLIRFMKFLITKYGKEISFKNVKQEDFIDFQTTIRKSEKQDPLHKWIGTWNQYLRNLKTFYRWVNNPDLAPDKRKNPLFMEGINQLHRKELTTYKPSDMWTEEEDAVFVKYCEDPRIRAYHMMARDVSARPHELLIKRIGDFKEMIAPNGVKYLLTSIGAGGKTKNRPVSVYHSYPYFLEWLNHHPTPTDLTSFLFRSHEFHNRYRNVPLSPNALTLSYRRLKQKFFPRLLTNDKIPENDKMKIKVLLQKPWNPYVRRHTSLTEKVSKINEYHLRQHAGWVKTSQMINRYTHELGDTSNDAILSSVFGIETKKDNFDSKLKPIQCVCGTSNRHDALYCINEKCKRLLSLEGYNTIIQESKKEKELIESRIEDAKKETEQKFISQIEEMQKRQDQRDRLFKEEIQRQMQIAISHMQKNNVSVNDLVNPDKTKPAGVLLLTKGTPKPVKIKGENKETLKLRVKPDDMAMLEPNDEGKLEFHNEFVQAMIEGKKIRQSQ